MKTQTLAVLGALLGTTLLAHADTRIGIGLRIGIPAPVIVREAPPPRRVVVERTVVAPAPNQVWVAGHYTWEGKWVWVEAAWVQPPEPGAVWVDGVWNGQSQQWIDGHWEAPQPAAAGGPPPPPPPEGTTTVTTYYSDQAPPPPPPEVRVRRPGRDYVWITGYWGWKGGRHDWVAGHWERPPHGHAAWVQPRWEHRGNGYVFVQGFWR